MSKVQNDVSTASSSFASRLKTIADLDAFERKTESDIKSGATKSLSEADAVLYKACLAAERERRAKLAALSGEGAAAARAAVASVNSITPPDTSTPEPTYFADQRGTVHVRYRGGSGFGI